MNSNQILAGAAIAAVLAMASPAYAGHLSGAGGLGGNLGGNLSGIGGASRPIGAGGFDSQGGLNGFGSMNTTPVNAKPVSTKPVSKTAEKADGTAAASATNAPAKSASAAPSAKGTMPSAKGTAPAPAATPEKPGASTSLAGGADQTAAVGSRAVSGGTGGSLDAQHSKGSTSADAAGTASDSIN